MARDLTAALKIIEGYEGLSGGRADGKFYPVQEPADPPGVLTVGKGHVVKPHEMEKFKKGLTFSEVSDLFRQDLEPRVSRLESLVAPCSDAEFCALLSIYYNNEASIAKYSPGRYHKQGLKRQTAAALLQFVYSRPGGKLTPQLGLWRRRMSEAVLYLTGDVMIAKNKQADKALYERVSALGLIPLLLKMQPKNPYADGKYLK